MKTDCRKKMFFLWENFGPMHADRCDAVAKAGFDVIGLELFSQSDTYDWIPESGNTFKKVTLFRDRRPRGIVLLYELIKFRLKNGKANWFLCHYEWKEIFLFACFLRFMGDQVFTMGCSKFDDWPRNSFREAFKRLFFIPYKGAVGSGVRSRDYFRYHGIPQEKIAVEYNTLSTERIIKLSNTLPAPQGLEFIKRHFTIVARLVPKKNLKIALDAYALYKIDNNNPRLLYICGSGPLEDELKDYARYLNIYEQVVFLGFVQTDEIARILGTSLALILPSIEEQFGNVVIEAQAMGLPVLISDVCGARDRLVRTAINGFIFEPDNAEGLAWFMNLIANNDALWRKMCKEASISSLNGDVKMFVNGVRELTNP
ncbi:glycosyltransferase family 4 protein [uncultured Acinetobacter sp.]|uniref:glycosyltransferase family 4 protein n=1 Tax=uncultured Acinetobacter sp. TaxID=165433 RepID=UPI0025903A75|nr:glycosyltransferase family 4 protein [uncultured Acinetobacter sp.]